MSVVMVIAFVSCGGSGGSSGSGGTAASATKYTMTLATHLPETSSITQSFHDFGSDMQEKSGGRITVNVASAGALGSQREVVEAVNLGTIEIAMGESGLYANYVPTFGIINLPFLYTSEKQFFEVMDGKIGDKLEELLSEKTSLVLLSWLYAGIRDVYASKPMTSLDSLKGLKVRTPESNVYVGGFRALGANPTAIAATEMYTALQQGVVEAMEGTPEVAFTYKIYEVAKNCLETGHIYNDVSLVINKQFLAGLPEDLQRITRECGKTLEQTERKKFLDVIGSYKDLLLKEGMVYAPIDKAKATAAAADFHKSYMQNDPVMQELYGVITAMPK
jgi:tripartite ATP-independent transporter DctP family solute receptor